MKHVWEATGLLSGDGESFCLAVTAAEFRRVTGREPQHWDEAMWEDEEGLYRLYPDHGDRSEAAGRPVRVRIEAEVLECVPAGARPDGGEESNNG